jgi:regulatory protein
MPEANPKPCLNSALRILARRDHSCAELKQKLSMRGFQDEQIKAAVAECLRLSYLDDHRFAVGCLRRLRRKGYGWRRIHQALSTKGISDGLIEETFEKHYPLREQIEDCRKVLENKIRKTSAPKRQQIYRFLLQRGFAPSHIAGVIRAHGDLAGIDTSE